MDNNLFPLQTVKPISLQLIIKEAFSFLGSERKFVALWIALSSIFSFIITIIGEYVIRIIEFGYSAEPATSVTSLGNILLVDFPIAIVFTVFAVSCHRLILLGSQTMNLFGVLKFTKREVQFLGWWISIFAIGFLTFFALSMPLFFISQLFESGEIPDSGNHYSTFYLTTIIAFLALSYLTGRLSLVLPATAVDRQPTFSWSWALSKTNAWRLAILVGVLPMLFSFVPQTASTLDVHGFPYLTSLMKFVLMYGVTTIEVAVLSIAFRELTNWAPSSHVQSTS